MKRDFKSFAPIVFLICLLCATLHSQAQTTKSAPVTPASPTASSPTAQAHPALPPTSEETEDESLAEIPVTVESLREEILNRDDPSAGILVEAIDYNVFKHLPKAKKQFRVYYPHFKSFTYGPFKPEESLYDPKFENLDEIEKRISVLEEDLKDKTFPDPSEFKPKFDEETKTDTEPGTEGESVAAKPKEKLLVKPSEHDIAKKIHLGDLYAILGFHSPKKDTYQKAVNHYSEAYRWAEKEIYPDVALNMSNVLLATDDVITPFPVIKNIAKEFGDDKQLKKKLNASLVELYFLSGRYDKAWTEMEYLVASKEVMNESREFRLRVGDVLFFLERYNEASEWYQQVLNPDESATFSDNVSWLYLAEALHQSGKEDVSKKIYSAMSSYFKETLYDGVIAFRTDSSKENVESILKTVSHPIVKDWMQIELLKDQFLSSPNLFPAENFSDLFVERRFNTELSLMILGMQGFAYNYEKNYGEAVKIYRKMETLTSNKSLEKVLNTAIVDNVFKLGLTSDTEDKAMDFLRFMRRYEFRLRNRTPDEVFELLFHNLKLVGMKDLAAEMTLHVIDKSIHDPANKTEIYLKLAEALLKGRSFLAALKSLELIDEKLIGYNHKEKYRRYRFTALEQLGKYNPALEWLIEWERDGASAINSYWIALRKIELYLHLDKIKLAATVIDDSIGSGKVDDLPPSVTPYVNSLLAYQVILNNREEKNFEALAHFYSNQTQILKSNKRRDAILAALSSALAINKDGDVKKLMEIAKANFDKETYEWLAKWSRGEMWINQFNRYLDERIDLKKST